LKDVLSGKIAIKDLQLKSEDRFDIATRLTILNDRDVAQILAALEKSEQSDKAKRYTYAARAGIGTAENKQKFWTDSVGNKEISESWIESALSPFNSARHSELTLIYLEKALAIVNKFLDDNPNLDKDLRLKILENVDAIERSVKIRGKY
jgi:hypothetical protein